MSTGHDTGRGPRMTIRRLRAMADEGERFACLACYDFTTARWLDRAGVHLLLVGDSAANVVLGYDTTHPMPFELTVWLTAAVRRGAERAHVMADMPFMSYQADDAEALRNAGRLLSEGRADSVKLEVDASHAPLVQKMTRAGIPVCAHIGTRPQQWALSGGPTVSGRRRVEADRIVEDAVALEQAGAVMLLIEAVPPEVSERVIAATGVPLIGIGAGDACHGQILVVNDLVGLSDWIPRFVEPVADLGPRLEEAGREWVRRVAEGRIGGRAYTSLESTPLESGSGRGHQPSENPEKEESVRVVMSEHQEADRNP
ncbi:MAG TPA: 3-methyl-2-oxobutanoate hydroxymethyltransferase [Phycisphaerales bacterium]|nr:3-methyl-2-oxobutanoate hydroxymethyltransferase [Phycisphaerales bacterium]